MGIVHVLLVRLYLLLTAPERSRASERGDVPGWVLITVMSAGIVVVLGEVATGLLSEMLRAALGKAK